MIIRRCVPDIEQGEIINKCHASPYGKQKTQKLHHDTKILCRNIKQRNKRKLNHNKEFVVATHYSSIQAASYP